MVGQNIKLKIWTVQKKSGKYVYSGKVSFHLNNWFMIKQFFYFFKFKTLFSHKPFIQIEQNVSRILNGTYRIYSIFQNWILSSKFGPTVPVGSLSNDTHIGKVTVRWTVVPLSYMSKARLYCSHKFYVFWLYVGVCSEFFVTLMTLLSIPIARDYGGSPLGFYVPSCCAHHWDFSTYCFFPFPLFFTSLVPCTVLSCSVPVKNRVGI